MVGQLGDVQQTFKAGLKLDEHAEVGELRDLAGDGVAGAVALGDIRLPRSPAFSLLEAEPRCAVAFLVDVQDRGN